MGGFCGAISKRDIVIDIYFGTDYHSHLGTRRGGMAAWHPEDGFVMQKIRNSTVCQSGKISLAE